MLQALKDAGLLPQKAAEENANPSMPPNGMSSDRMMGSLVSSANQSSSSVENPMYFPEIVEIIASLLDFESLKTARLLNSRWFLQTIPAWNKKAQIRLKNIFEIRKFLDKAANTRIVLPITCHTWTFQGETVEKLMYSEGHCEREIMKIFWASIRHLRFIEWNRMRWRYENVFVDPINNPHRREFRRVAYPEVTRRASAYHVIDMFKLCENLTSLVIHYPLLTRIKGAYIGPRQMPKLVNLLRFEIYYVGKKFNTDLGAIRTENEPVQRLEHAALMERNLEGVDRSVDLPRRARRSNKTGGETLVLRILDHSPNLVYFSMDSESVIVSVVENFILGILINPANKAPFAPKLNTFRIFVPVTSQISVGLQKQAWKLRSLHLKIMPTEEANRIPAKELHDFIVSFKDTLDHLELIILERRSNVTRKFPSSGALHQLRSIEIWGYDGSYAFLRDFSMLQLAIIGCTDNGSFEPTRIHFNENPLPNVDVQVKSQAEFYDRLNVGPTIPEALNF